MWNLLIKIILFLFRSRVNHATSCVIKPATVRGLRSGKKTKLLVYKKFFLNHLDEEDMRFSQSRSRRYISVLKFKMYNKKILFSRSRRHNSAKSDDSDHDRHSSSRSKSRKKSSKSTRSPKRRSRFILILISIKLVFRFFLQIKKT